jgi:hypothetical protein
MYTMDALETRLCLHVIASASFMADLLIRSILSVVFHPWGLCYGQSYHLSRRDVRSKRSTDKIIAIALWAHSSHSCQHHEPSGP